MIFWANIASSYFLLVQISIFKSENMFLNVLRGVLRNPGCHWVIKMTSFFHFRLSCQRLVLCKLLTEHHLEFLS